MFKNINILHCIASLNGGGAEKQLCLLSSALVSKGYSVHVVILRRGVNFERLINTGAKVYEINASSNYDITILFKVIKYIKINKIDIVQCWQRPMDFFGSISAILTNVKYITTERTTPDRYSRSFKGILKFLVAQFSSANICNSEYGQKYWDKYLLRKIPNVFIPNIIPFDELLKIETDNENIKEDSIIVVGRLSPEKNQCLIIYSLAKFLKLNSNFTLYFIGEGQDYKILAALINEFSLQNNIKLLGYTNDVLKLIKSSKIFISMSLYEGMPNSVFEAAALKIPLVLSDIPSHNQYFNNENAYLVNPNSKDELYNSVSNLWNNYGDAISKSEKAFNSIRKFDGYYVALNHDKLYKFILGYG